MQRRDINFPIIPNISLTLRGCLISVGSELPNIFRAHYGTMQWYRYPVHSARESYFPSEYIKVL